jgi:uncharacterized membrane protein YfcA
MEVVDATIGMGYGTILTPVLLMVGFEPSQIVPAVLISQLVGGFLASFFHHRFKNANFAVGGEHLRAAIVLGVLSTAGAVASVLVAINLSKFYLSLYIGLLAIILGLVLLATHSRKYVFSWPKMIVIGLLAAFNKGLSGGGYGPIVTAGQIVSGIGEKSAVSITLLSEALISLTAVFTYVSIGGSIDWILTSCLLISASFSAPVAAFMVKRIEGKRLKVLIGVITSLLGLATILKTVLS